MPVPLDLDLTNATITIRLPRVLTAATANEIEKLALALSANCGAIALDGSDTDTVESCSLDPLARLYATLRIHSVTLAWIRTSAPLAKAIDASATFSEAPGLLCASIA